MLTEADYGTITSMSMTYLARSRGGGAAVMLWA